MGIIWNLNLALGKVFDLALAPFASLNPIWGLAFASLITGAVMVFIFKFISNQEGIRRAKARVRGFFLEVWIYKHEFSSVMGSVGRILKANVVYMRYAVAPLIVMIVPVVLIMVHLNLRYGFRPFEVGETALLTVKWEDSSALRDTTLKAWSGGGIEFQTGPVRALGKNEAVWRIKASKPGSHIVKVSWTGGEIEKEIVVGGGRIQKLSPKRSAVASIADAFFSPGENPLSPETGVRGVFINYPEIKIAVFGFEIHWIIVFFVLSIAAGFALKGVFKVEI